MEESGESFSLSRNLSELREQAKQVCEVEHSRPREEQLFLQVNILPKQGKP